VAAPGQESNAIMPNIGIIISVKINQSAKSAIATYLLVQSLEQHIERVSTELVGNVLVSSFYTSESKSIWILDNALATVQNVPTISMMERARSQTCIISSIL
jgi:hypothetical protein